jgi:hypothetical protein
MTKYEENSLKIRGMFKEMNEDKDFQIIFIKYLDMDMGLEDMYSLYKNFLRDKKLNNLLND